MLVKKNYATRTWEWSRLIAVAGIAQMAIQAISFACGVLVIRMLSVEEYAHYTIAYTMLGTMTILADAGVSMGVMSEGGKVWDDKVKLGAVLVTGLSLRRKFATFSLFVAIPILFYLLQKHGASWSISILLIISLMPAFFTALSGSLLEIGPKLHQDISKLQSIHVMANTIRLSVTGLTLLLYPFASVAILASGISQLFANWRLRSLSYSFADFSQPQNVLARKEIVQIVRRVIPGAIYFCFSGQVTIWLISIFGSTKSMAQIGALGRFSIIFAPMGSLFVMLILPRFARLKNENSVLISRFFQVQLGLFLICGLVITAVWVFSKQILWVLGSSYSGLDGELMLMAVGSCISLIAGSIYHVNSCRGMVVRPLILIPYNILSQLLFMFLFDFSSMSGVLGIWICVSTMQGLLYFLYFIKECYKY